MRMQIVMSTLQIFYAFGAPYFLSQKALLFDMDIKLKQ